jgi:AcrR family transcriptional regulator
VPAAKAQPIAKALGVSSASVYRHLGGENDED